MRDSEQEYPLHQPGRGERHHPFDDDTIADERADQGPFQEPLQPGQGPMHQRTLPANPRLPRGHVRKTLIIGVIVGAIAVLPGVIFTLANASLFHTISITPQDKLTLDLLKVDVSLSLLTIFIDMLIYFVAGFITGKVAVERRMGFLAGFVAGAVYYVLDFVVHQIPGYPSTRTTGFSGGLVGLAGGIITSLIFLAVWGVIAGLVSLFGAWLATRRHPYYSVE